MVLDRLLFEGFVEIHWNCSHKKVWPFPGRNFYVFTQQKVSLEFIILPLFPGQHWGRVCAYGRGRSHVQGVPHPSQEPEDPGCRRGDHPPESRHQARDLVRSDHQLLDRRSRLRGCNGKRGFGFNFWFYVFWVWGLAPGLWRSPRVRPEVSWLWKGVGERLSIKVRFGN